MFSKLFNKTDNKRTETSEDVEVSQAKMSRRFSSADIVFGVGLLLIVSWAIYIVSNLGEERHTQEDTTPVKSNITQPPFMSYSKPEKPWQEESKIEKVEEEKNPIIYVRKKKVTADVGTEGDKNEASPFANYTQHQEPWYEKNKRMENMEEKTPPLEKVEKHEPSVAEMTTLSKKENVVNVEESVYVKKTPEKVKEEILSYVCSVLPSFSEFINKEIVYYLRKEEKGKIRYLPSYMLSTWDEKGMVISKKFMAFTVDIEHEMVKVEKNRWIPALKFSSCILVEGNE